MKVVETSGLAITQQLNPGLTSPSIGHTDNK